LKNDISRILNGKKPKNKEYIEYLFITANIKDVKFFGGDLTYPIYNFKVSHNDDSKYETHVSSNLEVIRIIDNLPLASTNDFIEAEIQSEAITNKKGKKINEIVASQLQNISNITNPSAAVLSLVGEFGKFMESQNEKKQYKFSSTIRLYEGQDFNKKLHSINIYAFVPSGIRRAYIKTEKITQYIDSTENPQIDRRKLYDLIKHDKYPYLVIANYKSKYITDPVIGDEIDFENIEARRVKTEKAFSEGLMNKETYIQEIKLIEFLEIFAQLKLDINNYKLNYANEITKDFTKNYFVILQEFRHLKNTFRSRKMEFKNNPSFQNEFKDKYESIILNAELYLEENSNMKNIKELVNTLYEFKTNPAIDLDAEKRESYLRKLYSVDLPKTEIKSNVSNDIENLIRKLEYEQFQNVYEPKIKKLNALPANDRTVEVSIDLKNKIKQTNCKYCRQKVQESVADFNKRFEAYQKEKKLQITENLIADAKDVLFNALKKESCIGTNLKKQYPDTIPMPAHIKLITEEFEILKTKRGQLKNIAKQNYSNKTLEEVEEINESITSLSSAIKKGYDDICEKVPELCDCAQEPQE
jgi:hypothetical protein